MLTADKSNAVNFRSVLRLAWCAKSTILATLFLIYGTLATAILAVETPPYQVPDEPGHFLRAEQISRGALIAHRLDTRRSGGTADVGISASIFPFIAILFHPDIKATREMYDQARSVHWGGGLAEWEFSGAAIYPPFMYAPAVAGIWTGKAAGFSIIQTLYLARAFTGFVSVAISASAIAVAGSSAPWLFALLSLPMAQFEMAAPTQDGLIFALSGVAAALMATALRERRRLSLRAWVTNCIALALVAMARPPYAPIAIVMLAVPCWSWALRLGGSIIVCSATIAWAAIAAASAMVIWRNDATPDPQGQLALLLHEPGRVATVARTTLTLFGSNYLEGFIGRLGWLDTILPSSYHRAAWFFILVAALLSLFGDVRERFPLCRSAVALLAILLATACIFGIQYLTWTNVGAPFIEGVQGRYFIPLALFLICLLPVRLRRVPVLWDVSFIALCLFPAISLVVMLRQIVLRYYLGAG